MYGPRGDVVAWNEDNDAIRDLQGRVIGWIYDDAVFGVRGQHVGYFNDGLFRDDHGAVVAWIEGATGGPAKPARAARPAQQARAARPARAARSARTAQDFAELVVPELRRRGRLRDEPATSLRDRIFGRGDRLPDTHFGARYRGGRNLRSSVEPLRFAEAEPSVA